MRSKLQTSVGLVGLPNVGKSTLFNALAGETKAFVANYPFATIDPNTAVVRVPDRRLERYAGEAQSKRVVHDYIEVNDIAGLIRGASQGAGLGNAFLSHIRMCDAIVHVVRCFEDANVIHVMEEEAPSVGGGERGKRRNPMDDVDLINTELLLADLDSVTRRLLSRKTDAEEKKALTEVKRVLSAGEKVSDKALLGKLKNVHLLTAKPVLYALITDVVNGDAVTRELEAKLDGPSLPVSANLEAELAKESDAAMREELAHEFGLSQDNSSMYRLSQAVAQLLNRRVFYTIGPEEARSWAMGPGETAVMAAGRIHGDIAAKFVNAEVRKTLDGKATTQGKDYLMEDGDIVYFRHRA